MRTIAYRPFAKELQDLTTSDLSDITGRPIPESHFVEYKSQFEKPALIKAVAAFANSDGGGTVLLGVEEQNLVPTAVPGIELTSSLPEQIAQTITSNITPVPDFRLALVPATDPNKVVAIIEVFPGNYPPYMLTSSGLIYVRGEVGSEPVSLRDRPALDRLFHQAERGEVWARDQLQRLLNRSGNEREALIWTLPAVEGGLQEHESIFRESFAARVRDTIPWEWADTTVQTQPDAIYVARYGSNMEPYSCARTIQTTGQITTLWQMDDGHAINIVLIEKMLEQTLPAHRLIYETLLPYRGPLVLGLYSAFFEGSNFSTVSIARGPIAQRQMESTGFIDHLKRAARRNFGTQHEPE